MAKRACNVLRTFLTFTLVSVLTMSTTTVSYAGTISNRVTISSYEMSDIEIINQVSNKILE